MVAMWEAIRRREFGILSPQKTAGLLRRQFTLELDLSNHKEIVSEHKSGVNSLQVDPSESRYLLAGASDGSVAAYDTLLPTAPGEGGIGRLERHNALFTLDKGTQGGHRFCVSSVQWYPIDTGLFITGSFDESVNVWDTNTLQVELQFKMPGKVYAVGMSQVASSHCLVAVGSKDPQVRLCDISTGGFSHTLTGHRDAVWSVQWSASSEWVLFTGGCDGAIRCWDIRRAGCFMVLDQHKTQTSLRPRIRPRSTTAAQPPPAGSPSSQRSRGVASSSGRRGDGEDAGMGTGRSRGRGRGRDVETGRKRGRGGGEQGNQNASVELKRRDGGRARVDEGEAKRLHPGLALTSDRATSHDGAVTSILPTLDGFFLLSSGTDSRLRLWDVESGKNALVNYGGTRNRAHKGVQLAVSPDSRLVYHPSGTVIQAFDLAAGRLHSTLRGHYELVNCLAFHPTQQELYSGSCDRQILVWSAKRDFTVEPGSKVPIAGGDGPLPDEDAWSD